MDVALDTDDEDDAEVMQSVRSKVEAVSVRRSPRSRQQAAAICNRCFVFVASVNVSAVHFSSAVAHRTNKLSCLGLRQVQMQFKTCR